jgi:3-oxoacyl-[acyl-carrier-protein] synthase II
MQRIVITGLGAITPIGNTVEEFWQNLTGGVSGIAPVTQFDAGNLPVRIAGEVKNFEPQKYMNIKASRRMSRAAQMSIAATRQALEESKLEITDDNRENIGVVINTGGAGLCETYWETLVIEQKGPDRVSPFYIPMMAPNMASCQVSITFGITGPAMTAVAACASGVTAFLDAVRLLRSGEVKVAITGGTEASLNPLALASLANMQALSRNNDEPEKASRPFDRDRDGFVFAEGAAVMILETLDHARARGARIIAEVLGGAQTADAFHITAPAPGGAGAARALRKAMQTCGIEPEEVNYIVAHGTGTPLNDAAETQAIKTAFGGQAYRIPISSPKSMVGHLLGAAGSISAMAAVLAIRDGLIPPTINLDNATPECDLDYVPNTARKATVDVALINGFGFGGQNGVTAFRAFHQTGSGPSKRSEAYV